MTAAASLTALFTELNTLLNRRSAGRALALMNDVGLTMAQMVSLFILDAQGPQAVGAIAQKVKLSPAAASQMIDHLVRGGLVSRTEDPTDRRSKLVSLAERGRTLIRRIEQERQRELAEVLGQLGETVGRKLGEALRLAVDELRIGTEAAPVGAPSRKAGQGKR